METPDCPQISQMHMWRSFQAPAEHEEKAWVVPGAAADSGRERRRPTPGSVEPHVAGSDQALEDAQLSGPAEVEAVVCGQVRRLSVEARLGGRDIAHFLP